MTLFSSATFLQLSVLLWHSLYRSLSLYIYIYLSLSVSVSLSLSLSLSLSVPFSLSLSLSLLSLSVPSRSLCLSVCCGAALVKMMSALQKSECCNATSAVQLFEKLQRNFCFRLWHVAGGGGGGLEGWVSGLAEKTHGVRCTKPYSPKPQRIFWGYFEK